MSKAICPYLGTLDSDDKPGPAIDYPSLENQCFAIDSNDPLLLADQATFCLSGGHRQCTRFQVAQQILTDEALGVAPEAGRRETANARNMRPEDTRDLFAANELDTEPSFTANVWDARGPDEHPMSAPIDSVLDEETAATNRRWAWAGAGVIFISLLLCGGVMAAYTGWQMVSASYLVDRSNGRIVTVDSNNSPEIPPTPVYLVVTATGITQNSQEPGPTTAPADIASPPPGEVSPTAVTVFPQAVTPTAGQPSDPIQQTPSHGNLITAVGDTNAGIQQPASIDPPSDVNLPTPAIDLQLEIPTRRPTPIYDIPTSTPAPLEPTATETPTPMLGTPVVNFEPLKHTLMEDECTLVRWHVENVRAVYYQNQGVDGTGQKEECMDDKLQSYTLAVILGDGSTRIYTTTIDYLAPTPTLTPTPSFTPEQNIEPTPTWTPDLPAETPTPVAMFAVTLELFGEGRHTCNAGSTCEFDLLVTNRGNIADNIALSFIQTGPWPTLFCADGASCSTSNLTLTNVTPGATILVTLKVNIASDAAGQTAGYSVQALSVGSSGGVASGVIALEVQVP